MFKGFRLSVVPLFLLASALCGVAQSTFPVSGVVVDSSGAVVSGATVRILGGSGDVAVTTTTDSGGHFNIAGLAAGKYRLELAEYSGLKAVDVPLLLTQAVSGLKLVMIPQSVTQEVNVGNDAGSVAVDSAANVDAISASANQLRQLPVFDQNVVAAMMPFMDAASAQSGGATIVVDGVEMKSVGVSASAIQEVRINNDPYSTEFNRPGRGRIEVTTKPGSSAFHGEANFTVRDATFNAKNHFALVKAPESRRIYEGHLTGPVRRDGHTDFIASTSIRQRDTAVVVNATTPTGQLISNVATPSNNAQASLRVTHDFSPTHRLQVGYNFEHSHTDNAGVGGIVLAEAGYNTDSREDDLIFNDRIIVTPNLINQLLVTFEKDEDVSVSLNNAPSVQVNGAFTGGGAQADVARTENTIHVNEVISWAHGRHYLRAGIQLPQFSRRAVDDHTNRLGTYQFASLANYALPNSGGTPYVFTAQQGVGRGLYWINEFGAFVQDQIKLNPKLQLSVGVRYDCQTFIPDDNNLAPRFSVAYAPGKGRTILRLGSGVFYDRTGGDFPASVTLHNGIVLDSIQLQNPSYPLTLGTTFTLAPSNLVRFAPAVRTPYSIQSSFGIERQLGKKATVSATYRNLVSVKSFRSRDANAPILPPNPSLTAVYARPDPTVGEVQQIESGGRALLNALDLSFRGQAGRWFSGQAQYTLARADNNTGGINWFPQNQYEPDNEWGRANYDRRQSLNLLGDINPDHWLSLGVALILYSGLPYTETTGSDYFHTGLGNARPAGLGRNTLQSGGTADLNLTWEHEIRLTKAKGDNAKVLTPGVSAFNVLNNTNYTNYIGTLSSSVFGKPTAAQPGRQVQFTLGFRF
jgi:outer membrane receptor protein involved in Fe transport